MIIMRFIACAHQQTSNSDAGVAGLSQYKDLWLLRLPTAPTQMRNLVLAHTLIGKIEGLEHGPRAEVLASLGKTEAQFRTTVARVTAKLTAQGMSAILTQTGTDAIPRGMAFETDMDVLNKNVTIYQDALASLVPETRLIREERLRVSGLRLPASPEQNFSEREMQSQMEAFLRRRESERPAPAISLLSRSLSMLRSFLSGCVSSCLPNSVPNSMPNSVTDPISLHATALITASTDAFRAGFGKKNTCIFTEMLKGLNISDQLITINSEYAKPAQQDAVKAALTELVQYHIEQGTGQEFTSAAIISQMNSEMAVHDRDKGEFLGNDSLDSLGSLAFSTFANAVGGDFLIPIKEKMDAIGNAEPMAIHSDQAALIAATTEVFDTVASLDRRMPESLKAVLRDVITAAGDEGKTAFNSTFFLRFLVPFLSVSGDANSPNKERNKIIADVLQETANAWSRGETTVSFQEPARKFLEQLALRMIGEIDALVDRIKDDGDAHAGVTLFDPFADEGPSGVVSALPVQSSFGASQLEQISERDFLGLGHSDPVGGGGASSRRSDDTAASSEPDRGSPAQNVQRNSLDKGDDRRRRRLGRYDDADQELGNRLSEPIPTNVDQFADEGQGGVVSDSLLAVPLHPPVGGGGSIARSSVRTAASGRQNSRYKASPSTPPKTQRAGASPKVAQTRPLSPGYTAASKEIDAHTHTHWGEPILQKKLQAVVAALPDDIPAEERERLQADISQKLIASKEAEKNIASIYDGEIKRPSPKKGAKPNALSPNVALRRNQISRLGSVIHTLETDLNALARKGSLDAFQAALTEGLQTLEAAEVVADLVRKNSKDDCIKSLHALRGDITTAQDLGATLISATSTFLTSEKLQAYQTKRNAIRSSWKALFPKKLSPNTGVGAGAKKSKSR